MSICVTTLLWAIAAVETGHDDNAIGKTGERSQYQISQAVWWWHQDVFCFAECKGSAAEAVARLHVAWLIERVIREGAPGDLPLIVASAWNQGVTGHLRRGPNDYARRVAAVYHAKKTRDAANTKGQATAKPLPAPDGSRVVELP